MVLSHAPQVSLSHKIRTRTLEAIGQSLETTTAIELADRRDHGVALGFSTRVFDCFRQDILWNINRRFHASKLQ